ncbi:MAG: hypothetical protein MI807_09720, partial [Verrucomicrobiales bacterium]|nr:hypothetical protein [Verrucomicrobiales bacterium]
IAAFQAEDGSHWNGEAGILATLSGLDYAEFGLVSGTPLILYTFPDVTSLGASLAPGDVVHSYRNPLEGSSGGNIAFSCPDDPGVYTLAALIPALGGDVGVSGDEDVSQESAGGVGSGGGGPGDDSNDRSNPTMVTGGVSQAADLAPDDIDYFGVYVDGLSQVIAYSTGGVDTIGYLYAPDGSEVNSPDADDDAGAGNNFRSSSIISQAGNVVLGVLGKAPAGTGAYEVFLEVVPLSNYRPDLTIGKSPGGQRGNGIYNTSGAGQRINKKLKKVKKFRLYFEGQNDGGLTDSISVRGTRGNKKFKISYYQTSGGFANVTGAVSTGRYLKDMGPLERYSFRVDTKGKRKVKKKRKGKLNLVLSASSTEGGVDIGRSRIKVKMKKKRR